MGSLWIIFITLGYCACETLYANRPLKLNCKMNTGERDSVWWWRTQKNWIKDMADCVILTSGYFPTSGNSYQTILDNGEMVVEVMPLNSDSISEVCRTLVGATYLLDANLFADGEWGILCFYYSPWFYNNLYYIMLDRKSARIACRWTQGPLQGQILSDV